jgi:predicted P-loop ATPase
MSKDVFKGRLPYAARETRLQRVANVIGSTNNLEFLSDETGNVRWIVFEMTDRTNFAYQKELDINRIWAQAYHLYKNGFYFEMTDAEILENEDHNKLHMIRSVEQELIQAFFYPPNVNNLRENTFYEKDEYFRTATDIKTILAEKAPHEKTILNNIGKALKILGYERKTIRKNGFDHPVKGYYIVNK